jgi:cysteinyl-tRNA synthetase
MAGKHLGRTIDIHAGGQDLIFPHHENELAQSTCAHNGEVFARYWLHNGFLSIEHEKMSKSLGNVLLVHDLIKTIPGEVIRLALLGAHYRQPLDWSDEAIDSARKKLDRFYRALRGIALSDEDRAAGEIPSAVVAALEDDLNTPVAIAEMFDLARKLNKAADDGEKRKLATDLLAAGDLLGLLHEEPEDWFAGADDSGLSARDIESLIAKRNAARAEKDFVAADAIRDELAANGVLIEDSPDGTRWRRTG